MKYPITNKNKPFYNSGEMRQDQIRTYHPRNPGSGNAHTHSGKSLEEYADLAQAATEQGDRILAQTYYQYAEGSISIFNLIMVSIGSIRRHFGDFASFTQNIR